MANTYDLTQTGSEVQAILNDANNIKGAGAQTTLTTDYILLKDTNGQYHKILKDSFTEACRNVLAGLLVNNDKGTTISQIAAVASGDFGSITPANLASVLDVFSVTPTVIRTGSYNDIKTNGLYTVAASVTDKPNSGFDVQCQMFVFGNATDVIQIIMRSSQDKIAFRTCDSGTWKTWKLITATDIT